MKSKHAPETQKNPTLKLQDKYNCGRLCQFLLEIRRRLVDFSPGRNLVAATGTAGKDGSEAEPFEHRRRVVASLEAITTLISHHLRPSITDHYSHVKAKNEAFVVITRFCFACILIVLYVV